ncbi:MAG: glutamate formimidoyltransferase [Clostridia bacterium]|nr:glutamate formimidoyltransferase [Clostridia bacterium]
MLKQIMECVPNFSEGRDKAKIEAIVDCFRNREGVILLDYSSDSDHNRTVVTVAGEVEPLKEAVVCAATKAKEIIDLRIQRGQHPRMGAVDVIPFIPIKNVTAEDAIEVSKEVGKRIWEEVGIPVFLYEKSATRPERENLAKIRKGEFEGMAEKMKSEDWHADFGYDAPHPSAGVVAVGCRMPLVAFNVNLDSKSLEETTATAKKIRHIGGGLHFCKAMGVDLSHRGLMQVSMNMTDYTKTPLYFSYELIGMESKRYGAHIVESEIIGLVPYDALYACAEYVLMCEGKSADEIKELSKHDIIAKARDYLKIADFSEDQVLEVLLDKRNNA